MYVSSSAVRAWPCFVFAIFNLSLLERFMNYPRREVSRITIVIVGRECCNSARKSQTAITRSNPQRRNCAMSKARSKQNNKR